MYVECAQDSPLRDWCSTPDVAIVVLGLNTSVESEGKDRVAITLPGMQDHLIKSIVATNTPTVRHDTHNATHDAHNATCDTMRVRAQDFLLRQVVVMMHGGAVAIEWIKDQVDGIVDAFYPGENGGQAIADVLFGDYNPGGTLNHLL
jgi:beta-glucosidase